jgi:hypothetical protein
MKVCPGCGRKLPAPLFQRCARCKGCRGDYLIYVLVDPRSGLPRYIGRSSCGIRRLAQHLKYATTEHTYKSRWICGLLSQGLAPTIQVIEVCPDSSSLSDLERKWIAKYRADGHQLTNLTDGGYGHLGHHPRPESIRKRVESRRGWKMSNSQREALRIAAIGRVISAETRAKISASLTGRVMSAEAVEKSASKRRGRKMSAEVCEKNRLAHLNQACTPETRAILSAACKGIPKSPETRAKMSAARLQLPVEVRCRKHTLEARAKMSAAQFRRQAELEMVA